MFQVGDKVRLKVSLGGQPVGTEGQVIEDFTTRESPFGSAFDYLTSIEGSLGIPLAVYQAEIEAA
jgi:hypothetical protein